MTSIQEPDRALLEEWLDQAGTEYYLCGQCEGLHIRALQDARGVIDSRLFLEEYGLLLTTELEIRPGALLQVSADLGRLNMDYPTLKIFLDVVDEAFPRLVVAGSFHSGVGLSQSQFTHFIETTVEAAGQLAVACEQLNYLYGGAEQGSSLLH
ncbi:MAG: YbjN domain-containing protein [Gammaproteobacteria bacterium]|nr:YbjN domain-containing protein [Gammaproteobacteria bacterium]